MARLIILQYLETSKFGTMQLHCQNSRILDEIMHDQIPHYGIWGSQGDTFSSWPGRVSLNLLPSVIHRGSGCCRFYMCEVRLISAKSLWEEHGVWGVQWVIRKAALSLIAGQRQASYVAIYAAFRSADPVRLTPCWTPILLHSLVPMLPFLWEENSFLLIRRVRTF